MDEIAISEVILTFVSIIVGLVIYVLPLVGECIVQYVLSIRKTKILGMIIPVISLVRSLAITGFFSIYVSEVDGTHNVVNTIGLITLFVFLNVVTVVEIVIYNRCRKKLELEDEEFEKEFKEELKSSKI